ncbi:SDR family oxidoreductase [Inquilinus limosus]|uniref:NmrA family transcriptional regulator n=1 Tax=Inquilinus limosus TaxID=171674 RepID=A0A211ZAB4_9PROT|nr:SDR family oxidoreductase [Inquilinus limosus]OWJ62057.1 NmrA family transcriptional regulator [Inquilinus limosus]
MKIVVIGGSGLIGSRTVALLRASGHDVLAASPSTGVNTLTGEGLAQALAGAEVVVDVANSPSFEPQAVRAFFETAGHNLLSAERRAGIRHHVALSIVGTDRMPDNGYFQAKVAQETLIKASGVPYTIVRATQFMEFFGAIAESGVVDGTVRLPGGLFQPIAAEDVAAIMAEAAAAPPHGGTFDIAGPDRAPFDRIIARYLDAMGDSRPVVRDDAARYFGGTVAETSLVPLGEARIGRVSLDAWLRDHRPA